MSLQDFLTDVKKIILGKIDEENNLDFKQEIQKALNEGKIDKADAALLIQTINEVKADANEMDKKQLKSIVLNDGTEVSFEELEKKKAELERKKREKEQQRKAALNNVQQTNSVSKTKNNNKSNKLGIDRNKLNAAIKQEEKQEQKLEQKLNKIERDGKN